MGQGTENIGKYRQKLKKKGFSSPEMTKKEYEVVRSGSGAKNCMKKMKDVLPIDRPLEKLAGYRHNPTTQRSRNNTRNPAPRPYHRDKRRICQPQGEGSAVN